MPLTTLDKLAPGESGRIIKVSGRGAIRRRLVDMGLTTGAEIEMVKLSPLGDPVEYRLRGYHLSLRKSEARNIEVELQSDLIPRKRRGHFSGQGLALGSCRSGQMVEIIRFRGGRRIRGRLDDLGLEPGSEICIIQNEFPGPLLVSNSEGKRLVLGKGLAMHIIVKPSCNPEKDIDMIKTIALAGNPNVGKSTLFNALTGSHQHVGNWPGKTVEKKDGLLQIGEQDIKVVDLPGTYSLTAYSIEEIITREFIVNEKPTAVVAVVNAANLDRNLYLVTQLIELDIPVIVALNMTDVAKRRGVAIS